MPEDVNSGSIGASSAGVVFAVSPLLVSEGFAGFAGVAVIDVGATEGVVAVVVI